MDYCDDCGEMIKGLTYVIRSYTLCFECYKDWMLYEN